MRIFCPLSCFTLLLSTSACSIHPIPFDIPGYNTVDIVRKIRCEAAKAIELNIIYGLRDNIAERNRYASAVIVYHYTFTITENNTAEASADFKLPLTNGTFTLGIGAGAEKERSGERDFTVTDTFAETLEEIYEVTEQTTIDGKKKKMLTRKKKECAREATGENWKYPITGKIGLDETIRTFVQLNHLHLLDVKGAEYDFPNGTPQTTPVTQMPTGVLTVDESWAAVKNTKKVKKAKAKDNGNGKEDAKAEEFSDELLFTTTLKANANPKIELKPVGSGFSLTGADATFSGKRIDKHKVIITLTFPKKDENPGETKERAVVASEAKTERSLTKDLAEALRKR